MMQHNIIGWDVGGAHLKAAWINEQGDVLAVFQEPCPLWRGLNTLETALNIILKKLPDDIQLHCLTMTGELVDLFATRAEGVNAIIELMKQNLASVELKVYAGRLDFLSPEHVTQEQVDDIASANWLASASYVAKQLEFGVFVDIGSTTTDILLLQDSQVAAQGYTDYQRLKSNELVCTGLVRTAVMAVAQSVEFAGSEVGIMSEYFATMADVYRLTAELDENSDQTETADGANKTVTASAARLARMIGCEKGEFSMSEWKDLAFALRKQQILRIQQAIQSQLVRIDNADEIILVGAGIGRFLVQEIAQNLQLAYVDFDRFFKTKEINSEMQISDCAPAVAVACLAQLTTEL